jgi:hypothetical protein
MRCFASRKPKVTVRVEGTKIIVTMPGSNFNVVYELSTDGLGLVANSFGAGGMRTAR